MLLNGGELNGSRLLTGETIELMARNHLPDQLVPIHFGPNPWPGMGYGLGFGVHMNTGKTGVPVSDGTFGWLGWGGTGFWVDPREGLIRLWLTQFRLGTEPVDTVFQDLVYQALTD
jgi:CubicO group peptidase (beta-lactamase class C family)